MGVVACELFGSKLPWDELEGDEAVTAIIEATVDLEKLPTKVRHIVGGCLEKDIERR